MYIKTTVVVAVLVMLSAALPAHANTKLPVPMDHQDYPLSCEAASLKMTLHYYALAPITENQLIAIIGHDPRPRSGSHWGDPDRGYIGSLYGRQNSTGYGVHWEPIARAAQVFKPDSYSFRGGNVQHIAAEVAAGHPVIVWGTTANFRPDSWYTFEGRYVATLIGEHTRVVIGFTGTVNNPTSFILNDPWNGRIVWSRAQFENNWIRYGNTGVVVK